TGSYYTPKDIVDFMVEESVLEYLKTNTNITENKLKQVISYQEKIELSKEEKEEITKAIDQIKIIDPAVGSGAFPIGILHKLVYILSKIDKDNQIWKKLQIEKLEELKNINEIFNENSNYPDYARKLYLIKNSIHGVDIQPIAIQITKLRIFLSLIIEQKIDKSKENFGIRPLPYLETKFIVANTLIGLNKIEQRILLLKDIKQLKKELKYLYKKHFNVKTKEEKLRIIEKAKEIKEKLAERLREIGFLSEGIEKVIKFDVFNQTEKADWFDPEWMFGIEDGFDIVIGNPPYVKHKKIKNTKEILKKQEYKLFTSTANLYVYFYEKGIKLLKDKGILSYITSNNWLKADYGIKLRKYLKENTKIIKIINFSNYKIFEQEIYTNIITLQKNKPSQNWEFEFVEVKDNNIDNVIDFVKNNYHKVKQENLYIISWNSES
ncbi:MAG: Eco57I restriction-modification methylase domain-containing protein, partial [Sulfurihydrogenibium sp.]